MNIPSQSGAFYFLFLLCQINTAPPPRPLPLSLNTPDLEQVTPISWLTFIFDAWKRELVWSLGSLFAASLSYQVFSSLHSVRKALRAALNPVSGDSVLRPQSGPLFPRN